MKPYELIINIGNTVNKIKKNIENLNKIKDLDLTRLLCKIWGLIIAIKAFSGFTPLFLNMFIFL